jgi:hypothetical protein
LGIERGEGIRQDEMGWDSRVLINIRKRELLRQKRVEGSSGM